MLTCSEATAAARARLGSTAEVIDCSGTDASTVDLGVALTALAGRGMPRVLAEGGPSLLGALIEADLLDELCLTAAPVLVGGPAVRIATGAGAVLTRLRRARHHRHRRLPLPALHPERPEPGRAIRTSLGWCPCVGWVGSGLRCT